MRPCGFLSPEIYSGQLWEAWHCWQVLTVLPQATEVEVCRHQLGEHERVVVSQVIEVAVSVQVEVVLGPVQVSTWLEAEHARVQGR